MVGVVRHKYDLSIRKVEWGVCVCVVWCVSEIQGHF